tara:strand:- start:1307 stop:2155 length:849 start_codon:yes stop_codon:yes gene_type:complete
MKNIISSGCSFTVGWRNPFEKILGYHDYRHIPTGQSASGNDIITRSAIYKMIETRKKYQDQDISCIVMFSGLHRAELRIENDHPFYDDIVKNADNEYFTGMNPAEFTHTDEANQPKFKPKNVWLKSGGFGGQGCSSDMAKKIWEVYYKNIHSKEERYIKLLENILFLQEISKKLKINLILTTWQNIFYETEEEHNNFENAISLGRIPKREKTLWQIYPAHDYLRDGIDWDQWCFINKNYDSLGEYHVLNNCVSPDDGHPSAEAYEKWVKEILLPHMNHRKLL